MAKKGFFSMTIDERTMDLLEDIKNHTNCRTNPEAIRFLIREWKNKNAIFGIKSDNPLYFQDILKSGVEYA